MTYKHLFGPIISRRLGLSLGVDLVPYKVCSLDCVYCEVGSTTKLTIQRDNYINTEDILSELKRFLDRQPKIDFITFSGAGEPTLNINIEKIIYEIKRLWPQYRLALITNSTMFTDEKLCKALYKCDLILPSLDAVSDEAFKKINRPHSSLSPQVMIDSLAKFRKQFSNQIWLEIFFLEGINDTEDELLLLRQACEIIKPDRIQINALDRPGAVDWIKKLSDQRLLEILEFFKPLPAEIIARVEYERDMPISYIQQEKIILNALKQQLCTLPELSEMLGLHYNTVLKHIRILVNNKMVDEVNQGNTVKYIANNF